MEKGYETVGIGLASRHGVKPGRESAVSGNPAQQPGSVGTGLKNYCANASLDNFVDEICALLINTAKEALDFEYSPGHCDEGLELAAALLEEARKYHSLYTHAYGVQDTSMGNAAQKLRNWNAGKFPGYTACKRWKEVTETS